MFQPAELLDSLTVLLAAEEEFLQTAATHVRNEWQNAAVLTSKSDEDIFAQLNAHDIDCVVSDTAVVDDVAAFTSRVQSDYPTLPMLLRTSNNSPALVTEVAETPHVDVLWRRRSDDALDELTTRIAVVVAAANSDREERWGYRSSDENLPSDESLDCAGFEQQLQHERDRFRTLLEYSSDVMTVLAPDGTIQYQSPSVSRVLGYPPEAMEGDYAFEYVHPEDRETVAERFGEVVANPDERLSVEYRFRHNDGNWRVLESIGRNYLGDSAVEGIVVNSRDVTGRKERLRILERLPTVASELGAAETTEEIADVTVTTVRDVLNLPITGLWLYDSGEKELQPVAYTPESEELFGDHPTFTPAGDSLSWQAFETGESRIYEDVHEEAVVHNPQTEVRSEMIFPLGRYGVITIGSTEHETFRDVDIYFVRILVAMAEFALEQFDHEGELRRQQEELRRQNERLEEFASVVSHDLRNPLNVASLRLGLARRESDNDDLAAAADALDRMADIIEDVLTLAREGQTIGETAPVDLAHVVMAAWQSVETGDADVSVSAAVSILADEGRLRRLFENLIHNAVEHADASRVSVDSLQTDGEVVGFYVEDDGPGIPETDRKQVFETAFTTATDGTGFGLTIVERIAEAHGWSVSVTDGTLGGARFEIREVEFV